MGALIRTRRGDGTESRACDDFTRTGARYQTMMSRSPCAARMQRKGWSKGVEPTVVVRVVEGRIHTMARSAAFQSLARTIRIARFCDRHGLSTNEGLERAAALEAAAVERGSRREFLAGAAKLAALGAIGAAAGPFDRALAAPRPPSGDVAIVGAGLAGLACGDELRRHGVLATIYEASDRSGGRCFSLGGAFPGPVDFPGQVAERGGEFIDTAHKTMIGYAQRFGLALEDVAKGHEDTFYYFFGHHHSESEVVDEFRELVDAMRDDLRMVGNPTADDFTPADAVLDRTNLKEYLETTRRGEFDQGCHRRGVYDRVWPRDRPAELPELPAVHPRRPSFEIHAVRRLQRRALPCRWRQSTDPRGPGRRPRRADSVRDETATGAQDAGRPGGADPPERSVNRQRDARRGRLRDPVLGAARGRAGREPRPTGVEALRDPEPRLRDERQDDDRLQRAGVARPGQRRPVVFRPAEPSKHLGDEPHPGDERARGADGLFRGRPRRAARSEARANGGDALPRRPGQGLPGCPCSRDARREGRRPCPSGALGVEPAHEGLYTCNQPGYFTTIADNERKPVGNLFFAGEHTSSFYESQGFMEGAAVSGLRAAAEVLRAL